MDELETEEVKTNNQGKLAALFSSDKADWETPQPLFDALNAEFHFTLDAAASFANRKVQKYFSKEQDAFRLQWRGVCWLNPEYGNGIDRWMAKAMKSSQEGATVVCLVPARTDTRWWFDYARHGQVRFIKGRLKFQGAPTSAPFPSAIIVFQPGAPPSTTYWHYKEIAQPPGYEFYQL